MKTMKQLLSKENPIGYCLIPILVFLLGRQVICELLYYLLQMIFALQGDKLQALVNGAADLIMIPVMWNCYVPKKETGSCKTSKAITMLGIGLLLCFMGMAACLAGNGLLQLTGLTKLLAADYDNTTSVLYGGAVWMQIFWMVAAAPVAEELVYRRILYGRIREYRGFWISALGASFVFGLTHGFILQGIYGFGLGLLLCFVLERYKKLISPILVHMAANACSLIVTVCLPVQNWLSDTLHFGGIVLISVFILAASIIYMRKTKEERK